MAAEDQALLDELRQLLADRHRAQGPAHARQPQPLALTREQLDILVAASVERELTRRRERRRQKFWNFMQKAGMVIAPLAGLVVITGYCRSP